MADAPARRRRGWLLPAIAGVAAVAFALGLAEIVTALVAPKSSPFFSVGSLLIDWAPGWAKTAAIALFGTGDKGALLTGIGIVLVLLSAAAGVLEHRRSPLGRVLVGAAGVFGVGAAITRAGSTVADAIPAGAAAILALIALPFLLRRLPERAPAAATRAAEQSAADLSRRRFLGFAGGATILGVLAAAGGYALEAGSRAATAVRTAIKLPKPTVAAAPLPAGADLNLQGLAPIVTANKDFYRIDTALQVPQINPEEWSLKITGMVDHPVTLTWNELLQLPLEESYTTLMCVSDEVGGDLISNALWLGYPIRHLLKRAGPRAGADMVLSRSQDGFTAGTPLTALQEEDRNAILAVGMNGEPLPPEHGFPVRMVVPGLYGYVSATKWVVEMEVTSYDESSAYWTDRGWGPKGPIKIESRIDVVNNLDDNGKYIAAGVAWHQHTGIAMVEVRVDDGDWNRAELSAPISIDTWVQWKWEWTPPHGNHVLTVRATGADGEVQTSKIADVLPDGATGYHQVQFSV